MHFYVFLALWCLLFSRESVAKRGFAEKSVARASRQRSVSGAVFGGDSNDRRHGESGAAAQNGRRPRQRPCCGAAERRGGQKPQGDWREEQRDSAETNGKEPCGFCLPRGGAGLAVAGESRSDSGVKSQPLPAR